MITIQRVHKKQRYNQTSTTNKSDDCTMSRKGLIELILLMLLTFLFTGCYHKKTPSSFRIPDSIQEAQISARLEIRSDSISKQKGSKNIEWSGSRSKIDSLAFRVKHHYSQGFNFIVKSDSLILLHQQPEEAVNNMRTDSFSVKNGKEVVVADIRIMPNDKKDSIWVQIATEDYAFGWIHESRLLKQVDPADPISQFISTFSNIHLLFFLIIISIMGIGYLVRKILKKKAHIVHINDISSFYPTLLAVIVALSAAFYASIQLFAPETWREFYFHPSLNPFLSHDRSRESYYGHTSRSRSALADMLGHDLGVDSNCIHFVPNTSTALAVVLGGIMAENLRLRGAGPLWRHYGPYQGVVRSME